MKRVFLAVFLVGGLPSCGDKTEPEEPDVGACTNTATEQVILAEGIVTVGLAATDDKSDRLMQHPRAAVVVGSAIVACNSDHIGILPLSEVDWIFGANAQEDAPPYDPKIVETLMAEGGLRHCEHLIVDESQKVIVTSSRGTFGDEGGLATWRLPDMNTQPIAPAKHLHTVTDAAGFGGIVQGADLIYAAKKPDRIAVFRMLSDGRLETLSDTPIAEMLSADSVALAKNRLYVTDPGRHPEIHHVEVTEGPAGTHHLGQSHPPGGGRLFILDVSNPTTIATLGWVQMLGAPRGVAVLSQDVVAVAAGAAGIRLFNVADPTHPTLQSVMDTPRSVNHLSYDNGFLMAADWNTLRLFEVSEGGFLRRVEATDLAQILQLHTELVPEDKALFGPDAPSWLRDGLKAAARVSLKNGEFVVCELDAIVLGRISPDKKAPRLTVHDPVRSIRGSEETFVVALENGGQETLCVAPLQTEHVKSSQGALEIKPGELVALEIELTGMDAESAPEAVTLKSNDPTTPERQIRLVSIDGSYQKGDDAPGFALPVVNECDSDGQCSTTPRCVSSTELLAAGKPIVLAFFSSW